MIDEPTEESLAKVNFVETIQQLLTEEKCVPISGMECILEAIVLGDWIIQKSN